MNRLTAKQRIRHRNADFRDVKLERELVGGVLRNPIAIGKLAQNFNGDAITSDRLKFIYEKALEIYMDVGDILTFRSFINSSNIDKEKIGIYKRTFLKAKKESKGLKTVDIVTAGDKLMRLFKARCIELGMKGVIQDLGSSLSGNMEKIDSAAESIIEIAQQIDSNKVASSQIDPVEGFDDWIKKYEFIQKHPETLDSIPTGIKPIDAYLVGLRSAEFGLLIAKSGVGKSIGLQNIATHCWKYYGDVIWVTIEMPKDQCQARWYCEVSGLEYEKFRNYKLSDREKEKLRKKMERIKKHENSMIIIDMPEGCTAGSISAEIKPLLRKHNVKLICIDYLNIMANSMGVHQMSWEYQVQTSIEVKRQLARKYGLPTWSVVQARDEDKIAFASNIKDNIDVGVVFTPTDDYEDTGNLKLSWLKTRDFEGKSTIITTDRSKMKLWKDHSTKEAKREKRVKNLTEKNSRRITI